MSYGELNLQRSFSSRFFFVLNHSFLRFMEQHPEEVEDLVEKVTKLSVNRSNVDVKTYNYNDLAKSIVHESMFTLQLEHFGYVDRSGNAVEPSQAQNSTSIRPTF